MTEANRHVDAEPHRLSHGAWSALTWPNRITMLRLVLVAPFVMALLFSRQYEPAARYTALGLFVVMAASDFVDGILARRLDQRTRLGAILDPLADKAMLICATVLLALELPDSGGDTQYVNMQEAYDGLPEDTKRRIVDLKAVQVYQSRHSTRKLTGLSAENRARVADSVIHPIVRTHPENGRKGLFINPIRIDDIVGMEEAETLSLLDELMAHATQDKYQYWHKWRVGDLVMWDNRCLLHKANPDYDMDQMRYLYRVMLKGDAPY